jgi:DNA-binding protein YbaB
MFDIMGMMGKVKEAQAKIKEAQAKLVHLRAEGESGAGLWLLPTKPWNQSMRKSSMK